MGPLKTSLCAASIRSTALFRRSARKCLPVELSTKLMSKLLVLGGSMTLLNVTVWSLGEANATPEANDSPIRPIITDDTWGLMYTSLYSSNWPTSNHHQNTPRPEAATGIRCEESACP